MFLSSLKYKFRIKRIENALKTLDRDRSFPIINKIKSIGVIYFDFDEKQVDAVKRIKTYSIDKNIEVTCFVISNSNREGSDIRSVVFASDLTFFGLPKVKDISVFCNEKYDMLLNLTASNDQRVEFVAANSKAKCRISSQHSIGKCYDLVFDIGNDKPLILFNMVVESLSKFNI